MKKTQPRLDNAVWRRMENHLLRRERFSRIAKGMITPAQRMRPTPIFKVDGVWHDQFGAL